MLGRVERVCLHRRQASELTTTAMIRRRFGEFGGASQPGSDPGELFTLRCARSSTRSSTPRSPSCSPSSRPADMRAALTAHCGEKGRLLACVTPGESWRP
jgi:hypothetical protein